MRLVDTRPPFAWLANLPEGALASLPTPCYLLDEAQLRRNGEILLGVQQRTGCKILLAQKAFSNFDLYPLLAPYLAGTEASGLYESRLGKEELPEKENHVFCAAYRVDEFNELLDYADHIVFNSPAQLAKFGPAAKAAGKSVGLRINPERSTQEGHAIYDPCAPGSRLGTTRAQWDAALAKQPGLAALLDGLHFHTLCEQDADALAVTLDAVEEKFGDLLPGLKWLNFGGGHHITRPGYDLATLEACIARMQEKYGVQVYLEPGEKMSIKNLLYCLLVRSGNDAANVLAMHVGGSIEGFVKMMNDKAAALGCKNTHFANVHGLDDPNHYTTARDLMTITKHALTLPYFSEITSTTIYKVPATNKSEERTLRNTNNLMNKAYADYYSPYAVGIKTGSTDNAGRCVISKGTGNGYNYLCVIMNAPMQNIDDDEPLENCAFVDCRRMFNWVFNHIELKSIASPTQIITEVPLKLSFRTDHISLVPGEEVLALVPTGADAGSVLIEPVPETVPKSIDAPVKKGQEICEARVLYAGEEIARIKLVASEDVSRNVLLFIGATIKKVASSTVFKIIASIVAVLVVGYIALFIYENYKRRQRRKLKLVNPGVKGNEYTEKKGRKKK